MRETMDLMGSSHARVPKETEQSKCNNKDYLY